MGWRKLLHRGIFTDLNSVVTRKTQLVSGGFGDPIADVKQTKKAVCSQCCDPLEEPPCFSGDIPCDWDNVSELAERVKLASKKFHCKFYAGFNTKGRVELLITSYNLNEPELMQMETFSLKTMDYKMYSLTFDMNTVL